MKDLKAQLQEWQRKVKAGNANKRGMLHGGFAPRVVPTKPVVEDYPAFKMDNGERVTPTVIRFRR